MEVIFMFIVGFIVFIIAIIAIIMGVVTHRRKSPTDDLRQEVSNLKKRVDELENEKKS